ncbi:TonB-dependent siderophore receptor [Deefgea rivuli]|uniref:TonB-dependent siderophore receptor n=1 Tax=Deefgea rivuli TaxID=400948 RepID=UPI00146FA6F4|nr:TonB-dependent siderophore receptor [Deefgea rivuli]
METPQSISVVTNQRMQNQGMQSFDQALRYTAGAMTEVTGSDLRASFINIRGFESTVYRDGLINIASSWAEYRPETTELERVEILKGPASIYGRGGPGGVVNLVSKRPVAEPISEAELVFGNFEHYQANIDVGRALNEDKSVLFRLNAMARNSDTQTDFINDDRMMIAPSLTWKLDERTSLTVLADVARQSTKQKSWFPWQSLTQDNPNGEIPINRFTGEPDWDKYEKDMASLAYFFEHQFDHWTLRQNARVSRVDLDYRGIGTGDFMTDQRTVDRWTWAVDNTSQAAVVDTQAETKFKTGNVEHRLLLGLDYQRFRSSGFMGSGGAPDLDLFNPVYGSEVIDPEMSVAKERLDQWGVYAQDQLRLENWRLNLSTRFDKTKTYDESWGSISEQKDSEPTYSAGLLYAFDNGFNPYLSYSTSFKPVLGRGADEQAFVPETGRQIELGVKWQPLTENLMLTFSAFDLRKQNVTTSDPVNPNFNVQTGEIRTRGLEFEAVASLMRGLDLTASLALLDPEITATNNLAELGKQPVHTAKQTASLWANYRFDNASLAGWYLGAGVRYIAETPGNDANEYFNPSSTIFDGLIGYRYNSYNLVINGTNLGNERIITNRGNFFGQARTIKASINYIW